MDKKSPTDIAAQPSMPIFTQQEAQEISICFLLRLGFIIFTPFEK
jgi:hypothetical protein